MRAFTHLLVVCNELQGNHPQKVDAHELDAVVWALEASCIEDQHQALEHGLGCWPLREVLDLQQVCTISAISCMENSGES